MRFCLMRRYAMAAALTGLLAGCASLAPPGDRTLPQAAEAARTYRDHVDLGGRMSIRYQNNGREEALHGNFVWTQTPARTVVTLLSPLGQTIAIIEATPGGATLTQSGQPVRSAGNVDALVADTLGWPLPVAGLRDWLQGFSHDAAGTRFIVTAGKSDVTTRDGWRIRYPAWQETPTGPMPRRIDLERYTAQAGDVSIRIVIDSPQ